MIFALILGAFSFLLTLILTPIVRDQLRKTRFVDLPDKGRKIHSAPIPRAGGISIVLSYLLAFAIISLFPFQAWQHIHLTSAFAQTIFVGSFIVFLSGLLDDFFDIRPWQKLLGQLIAALYICQAGIRIDLPAGWPFAEYLSYLATVIWLVGCTNAFNLIDGMDGLATGIGFFATITMLIVGLINNNLDLIVLTVPLAASLLGFLRYNFNPASIFLGDCGSLTIGFLLGCFALEWSHKSATLLGLTAPLMALTMPLLDTSLSICRRFLRNRPIFGADKGHIHHRLLERGLTQRQAALVAYGISGMAAAFSLLQSALHRDFGGIIILLFAVAVWIGIQNLGYVEFGLASRLLFRGTFGQMIDFQTLLKQFEARVAKSQNLDELWHTVHESAKQFGFHGTRMQLFSRTYCEIDPGYENSMQIRIPLGEGNYVNFHGSQGQIQTIVLNAFLPAVVSSLTGKLEALLPMDHKSPQMESVSYGKTKAIKLA